MWLVATCWIEQMYHIATQNVVPRPAVSPPPGNFLDMQNLRSF